MSRLADLINELCPDGVEKRPLGELLSYEQPTRYLVSSKNYDPSFSTPVLTAGATFLLGFTSETHGIYPASKNDPVIIFDDFTTASKWVDFPFKLKSSAAKILTLADPDKVDIRFLYYLMQGIRYEPTSHARHWISVFSKMPVFCPPLEVQHEIVKILDQFTRLEAELEAELEARRAQYEYYRNQLLSYDALASRGPVEWIKLKDIVSMRAGSSITSKDIATVADSSHVYPCYGANGIRGYISAVTNRDNASIIGRQGALSGNISFAEAPFFATEHAVVVTPKVKLVLRWLYHTLIVAELSKYVTKSAQPGLSVRRLEQVEVLFPSIEEQQRIADILDRFDALVNDISSGLPAEIAARRAQYEYYRDRLLSFPEKK